MKTNLPIAPVKILATDVVFPRNGKLNPAQSKRVAELGLSFYGALGFELWNVTGAGWVIPTLPISAAKRGMARRTYAIGITDKKIYTVGQGPHVTRQENVYVTARNFDRLFPLLETWVAGQKQSHAIRDRISTRRARGQMYRAEGRTNWRW